MSKNIIAPFTYNATMPVQIGDSKGAQNFVQIGKPFIRFKYIESKELVPQLNLTYFNSPVAQMPCQHSKRKESSKIFIKYMVSLRCKMVVKSILEKMELHYTAINLGEVELKEEINEHQRTNLKTELSKSGLELIEDKKSILIEKIKKVVIEMVHYAEELPKIKFSDYLSEKLNYDYAYLSNLFSATQGITINHFIIMHKIEHVKELIIYNELTLSEIAYRLHYSSVAHLSNQFKKVTGLTPSFFKTLKHKKREEIERL